MEHRRNTTKISDCLKKYNMNQRIEYIDAMRGLAILLVVICHCCHLSFQNTIVYSIEINQAIQIPLFFLISGFFASQLTRKSFWNCIYDKITHLIIPALLMLGTYCWIFGLSFQKTILTGFKNGYWFTFVLFGFIVLYYLISLVLTTRKLKLKQSSIESSHIIIAVIISYVGLATTNLENKSPLFGLFSTKEYFNYTYFVLGSILFNHRSSLFRLLQNKYLSGSIILIAITARIVNAIYGTEVLKYFGGIFSLAVHLIMIIIIWMLFHKYQTLCYNTKTGHFLSLIGRRSLDVYFLHYFFLPDLHIWGEYFLSIKAPLIEYLCSVALSIPVIFASLGIGYILRLSSLTTKLFLGAKYT